MKTVIFCRLLDNRTGMPTQNTVFIAAVPVLGCWASAAVTISNCAAQASSLKSQMVWTIRLTICPTLHAAIINGCGNFEGTIFAGRMRSAKTSKFKRLENKALYGIPLGCLSIFETCHQARDITISKYSPNNNHVTT